MSTLKIMENYISRMKEDGRMLQIRKDGFNIGILFVSGTDNPDPFLKKDPWVYSEHDWNGKHVVIEFMITKKMTLELARVIRSVIIEKFKNVEDAIWKRDREPFDKLVIIKKEKENGIFHPCSSI